MLVRKEYNNILGHQIKIMLWHIKNCYNSIKKIICYSLNEKCVQTVHNASAEFFSEVFQTIWAPKRSPVDKIP